MYNRNYTRSETFQDMISRLYPVNLSEVSERILYDENGKERRFIARTCTFQVTDACNLECKYCEPAGTKITMADYSEKNIEDIQIGDKILGFNENLTKHTIDVFESTVDQTISRKTDTVLSIKFKDNSFEDGREIIITPEHKMCRFNEQTGDIEWVKAGELSIGDKLMRLQSYPISNKMTGVATVISISKNTSIDKTTGEGLYTVYNIGTSCHTYISESVAVHNCYQINKKTHMMSFDTAKRFADMILDATIDTNPYLSIEESPGIVFEFIGGEPFMNIDLIQQISDYIVEKMIRVNHPWRHKFMFSICSNGVKYMDEKVQAYMKKYRYNLSFSISIDGNKPLHDSCRVFPDGSGSYDIAMAGVKHFREHYNGRMGSKMTMAPGNITYVFEAVKNLIENDYDEIFLNCVFEKGWTAEHATVLYNQFKNLSDYLIDNGYFETHYLSYLDDTIGKPMSADENENWCGGTGSMLSCDYKGDLYPCIRYMESSLGENIKPLIIGNVYDGIMTTPETKGCVSCLRNITRKSQSTYECFNCPIAQGCAWCSAYNYQENGTADKRATYICIMHKGRILTNIYYWNKGFRKYAPWFRYASWIPKEWALEIISEEEYNMLMDLIKFDENDVKRIQEMLDNGEVPEEYAYYAKLACETGSAVITNDITDGFNSDGSVSEAYEEVFKYIYNQKFEIDNIQEISFDDDSASEEEIPNEGDTE